MSYKFIVYGDMGMSAAAHATAKYALRDVLDGYEFIFHHGDISYARGYVRMKNYFCGYSGSLRVHNSSREKSLEPVELPSIKLPTLRILPVVALDQ